MNVRRKEKGFTIIEVVLVLAIAGLIFLMVFIALPALQRSQRDTARKNDVGAVSSAIQSYSSNNRGAFPDSSAIQSYVKDVSDNTDKDQIKINTTTGAQDISVDDSQIVVTQKTTCGDVVMADGEPTKQQLSAGTSRQYTVVTLLEAGGTAAYYCQNN